MTRTRKHTFVANQSPNVAGNPELICKRCGRLASDPVHAQERVQELGSAVACEPHRKYNCTACRPAPSVTLTAGEMQEALKSARMIQGDEGYKGLMARALLQIAAGACRFCDEGNVAGEARHMTGLWHDFGALKERCLIDKAKTGPAQNKLGPTHVERVPTLTTGVRVEKSKEWWMKKARAEGDATIGAGTLTAGGPLTDYDIETRTPEEMSVGKLNRIVRDLRERLSNARCAPTLTAGGEELHVHAPEFRCPACPPALPAEKGERRIGGWTLQQWHDSYVPLVGSNAPAWRLEALLAAAFAAPPPAEQERKPHRFKREVCLDCGAKYGAEPYVPCAPAPATQEDVRG